MPRARRPTSTLEVSPDDPTVGVVTGQIPVGYVPSLPGVPTLVQTFAIPDPTAYARTAFIEALAEQGVAVAARAGRSESGREAAGRGARMMRRTRSPSWSRCPMRSMPG